MPVMLSSIMAALTGHSVKFGLALLLASLLCGGFV
jgi:hypothetical protein